VHHLGAIDPHVPEPSEEKRAQLLAAVAELRAEG
jgi:hypothetical protein